MDDFELTIIEQRVRSQIGTKATYEVYDRTNRSPMNFVLDEAERQLSQEFVVYWVKTAFPNHKRC